MLQVWQSKLIPFGVQKNHHKHKHNHNQKSRVSTIKTTNSKPSISFSSSDSLFRRIQVVRDPKASVLPILREWVSQGRPISKDELIWLVRTFRDFRRFNHALQISLWMTESRYLRISPSDVAVRLDLIHRVHGLEGAENYFNTMSIKFKTYNVYSSLLRSYARENSVEKAEALMQEMRSMDVRESSFPYNILIGLYTQNGEYDKIDELMQEMERKGIPHDKYTLRNRLCAYIAASDVSGMEKMLNRMDKSPRFLIDWKVYSMAASGYHKLGLNKEALEMLRKLEEEVKKTDPGSRKTSFMFLLTICSSMGNKEELFRVWNSYKPSNGMIDTVYASMIRSLTKLDDIEGAERIFKEWESKCKTYEFRVVNSLLAAYCKKGLLDKAERVLQRAMQGRIPYASSWNILANAYVENKRIPKAIKAMKNGLLIGRKGCLPNLITLATCMDYLKERGDAEEMEEIVSLLKELDVLSTERYRRLLSACDATGESFSEILCNTRVKNGSKVEMERNDMDDFSSDDEIMNEIREAR